MGRQIGKKDLYRQTVDERMSPGQVGYRAFLWGGNDHNHRSAVLAGLLVAGDVRGGAGHRFSLHFQRVWATYLAV